MLIGAAFAIAYRSASQLMEPRQPPEAYTLWVLLAVIAVKEGLFRIVSRTAKSVESMAVHTDAWHHRSDAITSVAAAIGISVALLGGPGFEVADDIAALVAAFLIGWNGLRLLRPALNELMDTAPDQELISRINQVAGNVCGVRLVEKCIVRKMGYHYYVDMHVEVDPELTVQSGHAIAHQVKSCVREQIPTVHDVLVHIEPEKKRDQTL
jgi:cation diffusion facilitator family transporter